jgi:hypothetical protein
VPVAIACPTTFLTVLIAALSKSPPILPILTLIAVRVGSSGKGKGVGGSMIGGSTGIGGSTSIIAFAWIDIEDNVQNKTVTNLFMLILLLD